MSIEDDIQLDGNQMLEMASRGIRKQNLDEFSRAWTVAKDIPKAQKEIGMCLSQIEDSEFGSSVMDYMKDRLKNAGDTEKTNLMNGFERLGVNCPELNQATTELILRETESEERAPGLVEALGGKASLARIENNEANASAIFDALIKIVDEKRSDEEVLTAVKELGQFVEVKSLQPQLAEAMEKLIKSGSEEVADSAFYVLMFLVRDGAVSSDDPVVTSMMDKKIAQLRSGTMTPDKKIILAQQLGYMKNKQLLKEMLKDSDEWVRIEAKAALRHM